MSIFKKKSQTAPAVDTAPAAESSSDMETDLDEVMRKYDRESATRIWEGTPKIIITVIMTFFSLYCLYMTLFSTALPEVRLTLFVGCIIILGFLTYPAKKGHVKVNSLPWYDIVLMLVGSACFFYFAINAFTLIQLATRIEPIHVIIGVIGILVLIELCRRCVGIPILCVVAALLIYTFYNQLSYNPSFFNALKNVVYKLFYTTSGVIGTPINVCFTYIVLFIIFGAFLERTGIASFFIDFANRVAGWSSGGPAKVAVISSALCGMVSGSSVGNTVTTGSVTIPMMKKTGYKPEFAGAVEAAASTGGQIMPPIMGAAAFLMAEYMDLPYAGRRKGYSPRHSVLFRQLHCCVSRSKEAGSAGYSPHRVAEVGLFAQKSLSDTAPGAAGMAGVLRCKDHGYLCCPLHLGLLYHRRYPPASHQYPSDERPGLWKDPVVDCEGQPSLRRRCSRSRRLKLLLSLRIFSPSQGRISTRCAELTARIRSVFLSTAALSSAAESLMFPAGPRFCARRTRFCARWA